MLEHEVYATDLGRVPGDASNTQVSHLLHHPLNHDAALFYIRHMGLHSCAQVLQLAGGCHLWAGLHNALHLVMPPSSLLMPLTCLQVSQATGHHLLLCLCLRLCLPQGCRDKSARATGCVLSQHGNAIFWISALQA